jgi:hypothetical protein
VHKQRTNMALINLAGGIAVLGSYVFGLSTNTGRGDELWGGVPESIRPIYTVSMLFATTGYFAFTSFFIARLDPDRASFGSRRGLGSVNLLYALVLASAALWMPLTWRMIDAPSETLWWAVRLVLGVTGAGSLALLGLLLRAEPKLPRSHYLAAVAGLAAFCFQTAVLDALIWPYYFHH